MKKIKFNIIGGMCVALFMAIACHKNIDLSDKYKVSNNIDVEKELSIDKDFIELDELFKNNIQKINASLHTKNKEEVLSPHNMNLTRVGELYFKIYRKYPVLKQLTSIEVEQVLNNARNLRRVGKLFSKNSNKNKALYSGDVMWWCDDSCSRIFESDLYAVLDTLYLHFIHCDEERYLCEQNVINVPLDQRENYLSTCKYLNTVCYNQFAGKEEEAWWQYWSSVDVCTRECISNPPDFLK